MTTNFTSLKIIKVLHMTQIVSIMRLFTVILVLLSIHHTGSLVRGQVRERAGKRATSVLGDFKGLFLSDLKGGGANVSLMGLVEAILFNAIPVLVKQKPLNLDGKFEQNRKYFFEDTSNDEIKHSKVDEIIRRSGYKVEEHTVIADDGYITTLYHLINPLADATKLNQPPVMVMHGGIIDPTAYMWASAIQHHPEKYPRSPEDGPITSWNRSLAFTLANNGYDVWLVGTRGANMENQGRVDMITMNTIMTSGNRNKNMTFGESLMQIMNAFNYWRYSFDDIIEHEVPKQLDKILEITRAQNVSLFTYSFSSILAFPLLGSRPDIAKKKIHNMISLAPIINLDSSNILVRLGCEMVDLIPVELGIKLLTRLAFSQFSRDFVPALSESRELRYLIIKFFAAIGLGSSGKYRTMLEPTVLGHVFQPTSFQQIQHSCQIVNARRYQKYNYGTLTNRLIYGQSRPPIYNVSDIHVENWMLIWGENDNLAPVSSVRQILNEINPKPLVVKKAPGMNHLDLSAGFDNDIQVNLPTVEFLDRSALKMSPSAG